MTKVTMPDTVAWMHEEWDHTITDDDKKTASSSFSRYKHGLITTAQAEDYADARVREALEMAAQEVELTYSYSEYEDRFQYRAAQAIRALIPTTK